MCNNGEMCGKQFDKFDTTKELTNIGTWWKGWLTSFELYADSKGLIIEPERDTHKQRRLAMLLGLIT